MNKTKKRSKKAVILSTLLIVLLLATAGVTVALLLDKTTAVNNTFTPSEVTCKVAEDFKDGDLVKNNVQIQNTGDTDAYIRATYVVTWQKTEGGKTYIASEAPKLGEDYTISLSAGDDQDWFQVGDYYYHKHRVDAEGTSDKDITSVLIDNCTVLKNHKDGYRLSVEIIADAIQADGGSEVGGEWASAAEQAWGVVKVVTDDQGNKVLVRKQ